MPSTASGSFAFSAGHGREWSSNGLKGVFAWRRNLASPQFISMLADIVWFSVRARADLVSGRPDLEAPLGEYLAGCRIGEAFLDGVPMLVVAGGIRRDFDRRYQLHDIDQHALLRPITKRTWRVERHADVIPTIYEAVEVATSGEPGPVFVEIPVDLQLHTGEAGAA